MRSSYPHHRLFLVAGGLAAATLLAGVADTALAKRQRKAPKNLTILARTPLGLQGTAGAGSHTILPLVVTDRARRRVDVDVEFGWDRNGDGVIADGTVEGLPSEFEQATHSRRDSRDTSRVKTRSNGSTVVTYRPSKAGASHAFAWDCEFDLRGMRITSGAQIVRDETGRVVYDPFDVTQPQFTEPKPGVVLRVRATRRDKKRLRTEWEYTDAFTLDNSSAPSAVVQRIESVDTSAGVATFLWTAFDDDSEDLNGNGELDVLDLEDADGDGQLYTAPVSVAFDHYALAEGERVPAGTLELARLDWQPCTRAEGIGDSDTGLATAPTGTGRDAVFAWDFEADLGGVELSAGRYLIRAIPYDDAGNLGDPAYLGELLVIEPAVE